MIAALGAIGSAVGGSAATAFTAGASALGATASLMEGNLAMKSARYNAKVLEAQSKQDAMTSLENMARTRIENARTLSSVRAKMAGSGIDVTQGSSADYMEQATSRLELQILDQAKATELRMRARKQEAQAEIFKGRAAQTNAMMTGLGQLAQGGARIAGINAQVAEYTPTSYAG